MRHLGYRPALLPLLLLCLSLAGCGQDSGGSGETADDERDVADTVNSFQQASDAEQQCALLTDSGREYVTENFAYPQPAGSCEEALNPQPGEKDSPALVGPVGVEGDAAVAIVRFRAGQAYEENLVYTLRRQDDRWLIECPCVVPDQDELGGEPSDDALDYINTPSVLDETGYADTDGDYEEVLAVGDVGFAYGPGGPPTLLVNDGNGWRLSEISLGSI